MRHKRGWVVFGITLSRKDSLDLTLGGGFTLSAFGQITNVNMLMSLRASVRQDSAQQTMLGRVRDAVYFKRALMCFLLLMFVGNCQAFMQGLEVSERLPALEDLSVLSSEHDCCPDDHALDDCQTCLDEPAVKPHAPELSAELESLLLFLFVLENSFFTPPLLVHQALEFPPSFSSYPAIYLTQLHFLE